jgi:hypothetical protein
MHNKDLRKNVDMMKKLRKIMNFRGCPRSRVELFEKNHGMGIFTRFLVMVFGVHLQTSFVNLGIVYFLLEF